MDYLKIFVASFPIAMFLLYFSEKIKYGLHMLQQNSYLNKSYLKWVLLNTRKNMGVWDLVPIVLYIISLLFLDYFAILVLGVGYLLAFIFRPKVKAKKPLVVTPRVKRIIATVAIISLISIVYIAILLINNDDKMAVFMFIALSVFTPLIIVLSNIINKPIELTINKWYYNDAKKIISGMSYLKVIGITGSYGKTSTKFILSRILSEKYHVLMTPESYNTTMGVIKTIRNSLTPTHDVFICEMGAKYVGDIKEICDLVHPEYALITSIGMQHLETFKSIDNIVNTKYELIEALKDKNKGVINIASDLIAQNDRYEEYAIKYCIDKVEGAKYWTQDISYGAFGSKFTLASADGTLINLETKLLGKHNIANITGAVAIAMELGVDIDKIAYAIKRLEPVVHRLQLKNQPGGISIIDDAFNSNIEGAKGAVEVLGSFPIGGRILITPGIVELGSKHYECNFEFGRESSKYCDYIILVGKKQTIPIQDGVKSGGFPDDKLFVVSNLNEALEKMRSIAKSGSTVLLENDLPDLYEQNN